ncbi:DUF6952 family protein [Luteibaculum oceani]|uniref:Uncharacterized protein n=1 Tax=Luteibaculum oceani TaxID=1294296 RepID=A0A5C6V1N7_9FLAO|nr:hypothetical protein [Luteibaculum oceani]TXC78591.1 hypothetical protein FRX97_07700 [Luteibaculum oceani]
MKISAIKKAVEHYDLKSLEQAEEALMNEQSLPIEIEGEDEGEQLTHIIAAKEIRKEMESGVDSKQALRNYTQRVRNSIS